MGSAGHRSEEAAGLAFSQRVLAFEAATGIPHELAVLLAAPFAIFIALRWWTFRLRERLARASKSSLKSRS